MDVVQTVLIILTMAGLFLDRLYIYIYTHRYIYTYIHTYIKSRSEIILNGMNRDKKIYSILLELKSPLEGFLKIF